jgi:hypothetical protein
MKQKRINIFLQVVELDQSILAVARATRFYFIYRLKYCQNMPFVQQLGMGATSETGFATFYLASRVLPICVCTG